LSSVTIDGCLIDQLYCYSISYVDRTGDDLLSTNSDSSV